jgi:hypothetical protein
MQEEQDIRSEPEAPVGESEVEATSVEGQGAPSFHYKTHDAAEEAAKRFQGEKDRLQAELDKLLTLPDGTKASAEELRRFRDHMLPLTERPDFQDFVRGSLGPRPAEKPDGDDEFLTDAERAARQEIGTLKEEVTRQKMGLAKLHFGDRQKEIEEKWGGLLTPYKDKAEKLFEQLIQVGGVADATKIDRTFVENLYWQQVPEDDRDALIEKRAETLSQRRLEHQQARGTTIPSAERPSEEEKPTTNLREAFERANRLVESQRARGG